MDHKEIIRIIEAYVEAEAEKWLQSAIATSDSVADLHNVLWEQGLVKKDGTDIEKMLHHLIYTRGSEKAKALIVEVEKSLLKEALYRNIL